MARSEGVTWCDGCGVEITWAPLVRVCLTPASGQAGKRYSLNYYCCRDCAENVGQVISLRRVCRCGDRMEMEDERRTTAASYAEM